MQNIAETGFNIVKSVNGDPSKLTEDDKKRGVDLDTKMGELQEKMRKLR